MIIIDSPIICYECIYFKTCLRGGIMNLKMRHSSSRRPLELKSSGNESIGIDLTSKKDFMKKHLFFFENELIKVENS